MEYSEALALTTGVQLLLNDDKNVFLRTSQAGKNYGVGIRRASFDNVSLEKIMFVVGLHKKTVTIGPVDRAVCPLDVFVPVVGQWHSECLIAIIY